MARPVVVPIGDVAAAALTWRHGGELLVTVVVKATFALGEGGAMRLVAAVPVRAADVHHDDSPNRSIREAADLAPVLRRADVTFAGSAHAAGGAPVHETTVRLAVLRGPVALIDKSLRVVGDRVPERGGPPGPPAKFAEMPLVYERALGGVGSADNPLGSPFPNVQFVDPERPGAAGFAPISAVSAARRRLATAAERKALGQEIPEIAAGIDEYFQAAPPDQRIDSLHLDERIVLEGLLRGRAAVSVDLPAAQGRAIARSAGGESIPIDLVADTLFIDGDAEQLSITWRGAIHCVDAASLRIAAGVELGGAPISWPDLATLDLSALREDAPRTERLGKTGTFVLDREPAAPRPKRVGALDGTLALSRADAPARGPALPFAPSSPVPRSNSGPIAGAPWSDEPARPVPSSHALSSTLDLDVPTSAPVTTAASVPEVRKAEPVRWRGEDEGGATRPPAGAPKPPAGPVAPPRAVVKKTLYGKFDKG